jgi:DNA-3-methyladenine glycosylase
MTRTLKSKDFAGDALEVARRLIGATLLVDGVGGVIVETEAYDMSDAAAHTHRGPTERNRAMFGPPGHAYVYFNYGLHWCLNFVCREEGHGAGVLIRALQPTHGLERMRAPRPGGRAPAVRRPRPRGPGAGHRQGLLRPAAGSPAVRGARARSGAAHRGGGGPRIGISKAQALPWRFGLAGSRYVSRRF